MRLREPLPVGGRTDDGPETGDDTLLRGGGADIFQVSAFGGFTRRE